MHETKGIEPFKPKMSSFEWAKLISIEEMHFIYIVFVFTHSTQKRQNKMFIIYKRVRVRPSFLYSWVVKHLMVNLLPSTFYAN